jgi:hypothetical protein
MSRAVLVQSTQLQTQDSNKLLTALRRAQGFPLLGCLVGFLVFFWVSCLVGFFWVVSGFVLGFHRLSFVYSVYLEVLCAFLYNTLLIYINKK